MQEDESMCTSDSAHPKRGRYTHKSLECFIQSLIKTIIIDPIAMVMVIYSMFSSFIDSIRHPSYAVML